MSAAWKAVVEKVGAGGLSWRDIASGDAADDPAVRAAIAADNLSRHRAAERGSAAEDTCLDKFTVYRKC